MGLFPAFSFSSPLGYRWFGFLSVGDGDGIRFTWLEINPRWGLALKLWNWGEDDHWSLHLLFIFGSIFIRLPFLPRRSPTPYQGGDSWGFSWDWAKNGNSFASDIHLNWRDKCKIIHLPWRWEWFRTSILAADGVTWVHDLRRTDYPLGTNKNYEQGWRGGDHYGTFAKIERWTDTRPYRYVLKSGAVQEGIATIEVREMEWRMPWTMGLAWPRLVRRSIDVKFSGEVGERAGSWKGGTIGCSHTLLPQETPHDCLDRMMREVKFR